MLLHVRLRNLRDLREGARRHSYRMAVLLEMLLSLVLGLHLLGRYSMVHGRRSLMMSGGVSIMCELTGSRLLIHGVNVRVIHRRIWHVTKIAILGTGGRRRRRCTVLLGTEIRADATYVIPRRRARGALRLRGAMSCDSHAMMNRGRRGWCMGDVLEGGRILKVSGQSGVVLSLNGLNFLGGW